MPFQCSLPAIKTLVSSLLLSLSFHVSAQYTIDNSVFPAVGDTLHYAFGNQPGAINQIFTPPGINQQWDLSNLQATHFHHQIIQAPSAGAANAFFPQSTILTRPYNSNDQVYWQVTGNQVNDLGYYGLDELGLGLTLLFKKTPALEQSWAPISFFDIRQSAANVLTAFDAPMAPPLLLNLVPTADSFRIRVAYQRIATVDAFGTLAIPGGTFDVLRQKQTEYKSTAVDVKVAPLGWIDISTIGGQLLLPLGADTITTFHFLNNASKEPIAICTLNTAQNTVTGVQYKALAPSVGLVEMMPDWGNFNFSPNPARQNLNLTWNQPEAAHLRIELRDITGRQLLTLFDEHASAGPHQVALDLPPLPTGLQVVQVSADGVLVHTGKLLISAVD